MKIRLHATVLLALLCCSGSAASGDRIQFPTQRPEGACYPRPFPSETLDVSPPGFCWWPAGKRGEVRYRLRVSIENGAPAYVSSVIEDPAHVPLQALPAGRYTWTVEALDREGKVRAAREPARFAIAEKAVLQPWTPAEDLLERVPRAHPRLLFPKAVVAEVRSTLDSTRREAFATLRRNADAALRLAPPPEPDYDKLEDDAARRIAYTESFRRIRQFHDGGMVNLSLMYLLTGERKYGEAAKAILLGAAEWDPEGISSVLAPYGDEIGLGLAKSAAQAYDWIYDLLSETERARVRQMLIARADQMLRRLTRNDFLARPENSHDGRLPGYLIEHAIALAEEPRARVWLDYAMRAVLTVFPHWAGYDGGWAEGSSYALAYNTIYLTPFESLRAATGLDLWQRPFYRKIRHWFVYNISPQGDVLPWGDGEDGGVPGRASSIRALLQFHALRYGDPAVRGWVNLLRSPEGGPADISALPGIILPDTLAPESPASLPHDAVFYGVGWAALHTDLGDPDRDLMVMFKSSPYGAVSHSHGDQNTFVVMKGGQGLAIPGGYYFPTYGGPHHANYTRQTAAHNGLLVNGQGQVLRQGRANGHLAAFESQPHLAYVCGDATAAYGGRLSGFRRHVLLVRPSIVVVVDDVSAPEAAELQWLLHAKDKFELDEPGQTIVSRRGGAAMKVHLAARGGFGFRQTSDWPVAPNAGFPTSTRREPDPQWHFTATTRERAAERRIAAVMFVDAYGEVRQPSADTVEVAADLPQGRASMRLHLGSNAATVLEARYQPRSGNIETLSAKR